VVPGQYTVKLAAGGQTYSQPLTVVPDPRVKVSNRDLQAEFAATQQVDNMIGEVTQARQQGAHLHQQLQQLHSSANQPVAAAADSLDQKLMAVLGAPSREGAAAGPGVASDDFTSLEYLGRSLPALAFSIDGAPAAPTQGDLNAIANARKTLDADMAKWNQIKTSDMPQLNTLLRQNGLTAVE
jgi:hypothetical protein